MGIGTAVGEELIREQGRLVNGAYINYALPRAADVPRIRPVIVDVEESAGPYGAKSVGEMSLIPAGAAVANAVADAVGVRIRSLPITPDKVLVALAKQEGRRRRFHVWRRPSRWWIALIRWLYPRGLHAALDRYGSRFGRGIRPPSPLGPIESSTSLEAVFESCRHGATPIGGATDVTLRHRQGLAETRALVSLSLIPGMRQIESTADGWNIGAAVRLTELADFAREELPALTRAIESIATPQIRNVATVAGNLSQEKRCWFYRDGFSCYKRSGPTNTCYAVLGDHRFQHAAIGAHRCQAVTPSDLATVLYTLDARITLASASGSRSLSIDEFLTGPGETALNRTR